MATRMQQRRGTAAQWTAANPVLAPGEIGFETDTNKFKVGDGDNQWGDLLYFVDAASVGASLEGVATEEYVDNAVSALVDGAPGLLNTLNELAAAIGDDDDFFTTVNTELQTLGDAASTLGQTQATIVSDLSDLTTTVNDLSTSVSGELSDISSTVDTLGTALQTLDSRVDTLDTSTAGLSSSIEDLQTSLATAQTDIGTVSDDVANLTTTVSENYTTLSDNLDTHAADTTNVHGIADTSVLVTTTQLGTKQDKVTGVSDTEIGYLDGVTSAIQTQLNGKAASSHTHGISDVTGLQTALDAKASLSGATFTGDVTVETDLIIDGNLTISGTTTTVSAQDLVVSDPLIYIGEGNTANLVDIGLVGSFDNGTYQHSGIARDASAGKWKLFKGVTDEPTTTINFGQGSLDDLAVNNVEVSGVVFSDGTQTKQGVPSITTISAKTDSYTLSNLNERDTIIEISKSSATTLTIPTNSSVAYPVGTTIDIIQTGTGQVTIAGAGGVTVNATPGLKLRTQWSSATLLKRAENTWLVYGDLSA